MKKDDVIDALISVRDAREKWGKAQREFQASVTKVMALLVHQAVINYMSPEEIARLTGMTKHAVRMRMRAAGLDPKAGKRVLSYTASKALAENSELMGIRPDQMDLLSPLAYLPMGGTLRQELQMKTAPPVTELPEFPETAPEAWAEWAAQRNLHEDDNNFRAAFMAGYDSGSRS